MSKRDFIADLKDYAKRPSLAGGNTGDDWARLREVVRLHKAMDAINPDSLPRKELAKHVVVTLAALYQTAVRRILTEAIDAKDKRGERIPELAKLNISLTTELARELRDQSFSVGRFVARFLKTGSVDRISESLKDVCGKSLAGVLRPGMIALAPAGAAQPDVEKRLSQTLRRLETLFSLRRVLCSEEGLEVKIEPGDVDTYVEDAVLVIPALTHYRYQELHAPRAAQQEG
jgi:hypothetical protein